MSKMTIIEGNSNDKDNVRAYMVKGEPGDNGVSPTIASSKSGSTTTLTIVDAEGTKQAIINDGFSPTVEASKEDGITTVEITDINGTRTTEIVDGIDLTGGVPTDGVIGFDGVAADIPDRYEVVDNDKYVSVGATAPTTGERVWFAKSKNLYNEALPTNNTWINSSGQLTTLTGCSIQKINCIAGETYTLSIKWASSHVSDNGGIIAFYDSTNNLLSRNPAASITDTLTLTKTAPANSSYMYVGHYINNPVTTQLEPGSTASEYEPYAEEGLYVDEKLLYQPPVVLWTNPDPTSEFATQTITLNDSLNNYAYYEIICREQTTVEYYFSTGKVPADKRAKMFYCIQYNFQRYVSGIGNDGNSMTFTNCEVFSTYGNNTTAINNARNIPYQILGYK